MSDLNFQSVLPDACRPTGPAAPEASAPILNLLVRSASMPFLLITNITRSIASPPACNPQLPPVKSTGAGALHPFELRQVATPLPCSPPNTSAILTIEGITTTHFASVKA